MFIKDSEALCNEIKNQGQQSTKSGAAVSNHDQGSNYESSSESSVMVTKSAAAASNKDGDSDCESSPEILEADEDRRRETEAMADMSIFDENQESATQSQEEAPHRRDSYHMAMEMVIEDSIPSISGRCDSFHQAIDAISASEPKRRGSFSENTRVSFGGKKFHVLPAEFTDLVDGV
jgi:hypothetical protein